MLIHIQPCTYFKWNVFRNWKSNINAVYDFLPLYNTLGLLLHPREGKYWNKLANVVFCFILILTNFCFIQVLDLCYRVLREFVVNKNPTVSNEVLKELRDMSSMAFEHFEEQIVPTIKGNRLINSTIRNNSSSPRFIRSDQRSNSESPLPSTSSIGNSYLRPVGSFVRSPCGGTPTANSGLEIELIVEKHEMLINSQKGQISDLQNRVLD